MRWSELVAKRFDVQLPPDLRAWLDDEIWRQAGGAEFCRPRTPEQIVSPEPGSTALAHLARMHREHL